MDFSFFNIWQDRMTGSNMLYTIHELFASVYKVYGLLQSRYAGSGTTVKLCFKYSKARRQSSVHLNLACFLVSAITGSAISEKFGMNLR